MEKNTKILLGLGAVIAAYLILKRKKAIGQTAEVSTPNQVKTKDCVVKTYNCVTTTYKTIQIPIDDEKCDTPMRFGGYQPEPPPCAGPLPDMSNKKFDIMDYENYTPDRTNWGTWGN